MSPELKVFANIMLLIGAVIIVMCAVEVMFPHAFPIEQEAK